MLTVAVTAADQFLVIHIALPPEYIILQVTGWNKIGTTGRVKSEPSPN